MLNALTGLCITNSLRMMQIFITSPHCVMRCSWARFLSPARSKLRLCSANHRPGYWSNLPCDWPSTAWAYSKQETENGPWSQVPTCQPSLTCPPPLSLMLWLCKKVYRSFVVYCLLPYHHNVVKVYHDTLSKMYLWLFFTGTVSLFSCDQAALQMVFSVRPSVRPSVTPFWLCSHHRIIMKFSGVITNDWSKVHAKGQGQRSRSQRSQPNLTVSGL